MIKKRCLQCSRLYDQNSPAQKYCSPKCVKDFAKRRFGAGKLFKKPKVCRKLYCDCKDHLSQYVYGDPVN